MQKQSMPIPGSIIDKPLNIEETLYEQYCREVNSIVGEKAMNHGVCQPCSKEEKVHVYQDANLRLKYIDSVFYGDDRFLVEVNRRFLDDLDIHLADDKDDPYELVYEFADSFDKLLTFHRPGRWLKILLDLD